MEAARRTLARNAVALRNLSIEEMLAVSAPWVDLEHPAYQELVSHDKLSGLAEDVRGAHLDILSVAPPPIDPRRDELIRRAADEDAEHDRLARGVFGTLTELALLDPRGPELIVIRNTLMPDGIAKVTQSSYRAQAGYGRLVQERLHSGLRQELAAITLRDGHMLEFVEAWLRSAARLGVIEEERAQLDEPSSASTARKAQDARNRWIRTVHALRTVAELVELDVDTDRLLFSALRDAEAKADQRVARRATKAAAAPVPVEK